MLRSSDTPGWLSWSHVTEVGGSSMWQHHHQGQRQDNEHAVVLSPGSMLSRLQPLQCLSSDWHTSSTTLALLEQHPLAVVVDSSDQGHSVLSMEQGGTHDRGAQQHSQHDAASSKLPPMLAEDALDDHVSKIEPRVGDTGTTDPCSQAATGCSASQRTWEADCMDSIHHYEMAQHAGRGSFGEVWRAQKHLEHAHAGM